MNEPSPSSTYALILAGGSGTRFWPLSRKLRPKQLLSLVEDEKCMLLQTVERLSGWIAPENILILTNSDQEQAVRELLYHQLPANNILSEPEKRDTAPAIALAAGWVAARDPNATLMVLPSDQLIKDVAAFRQTLAQGIDLASREAAIITIGIKPSWPCTDYGYIQKGAAFTSASSKRQKSPVYQVDCFREKPNAQLAAEFIEQGNFTWNAGIFVWAIPTLIRELQQHCPPLAEFIEVLRTSADFSQSIQQHFSTLPKISIDYALMEKASCVLNIEATFDWDDLGNWVSAAKYFEKNSQGNVANTSMTSVESSDNVVYSEDKVHIALLGVNNLIVVQTSDAILVAAKGAMDEMKNLVDQIPDELT
ncbi:MAG: NTP transferase domain-containing protein [Verrucomicrobiales bacterium]|nr:NTP transferase domain-containing protein [Verrucomicrobiales bacterium]